MSKITTIEELVKVLRETGILPKNEEIEDWIGGSLKGDVGVINTRIDMIERKFDELNLITNRLNDAIERIEVLEAKKPTSESIEFERITTKMAFGETIKQVMKDCGGKIKQRELVEKLLEMRAIGKWVRGKNKTEEAIHTMCATGDIIKRKKIPESRYEYVVELV